MVEDDHNYYIDLRISLPMRWACQAIADRVGGRADDTLYLFWEEIMDVSAGRRPYDAGLRSLVEQRKQYFDYWLERRPSLPKVVGTIPESVNDPILIEIFGLNSHFLRAVEAGKLRRAGQDADRRAGLQGHRPGARPRPAQRRRTAPAKPGRGAGLRVHLAEWTPAFAKTPPAYATRRQPVARGHRRPGVRRAHGDRGRPGHDGHRRRQRGKVNGTTGQVTVLKQAPNGQG